MTTKPKNLPYCSIVPTTDLGFSKEVNRYFVMFNVYVTKLQKTFIVYCSCDDYDEIDDSMKRYGVEFLKYEDMNNVSYPFDKQLFQEIESAAKDIFCDLKFEEKSVIGV